MHAFNCVSSHIKVCLLLHIIVHIFISNLNEFGAMAHKICQAKTVVSTSELHCRVNLSSVYTSIRYTETGKSLFTKPDPTRPFSSLFKKVTTSGEKDAILLY